MSDDLVVMVRSALAEAAEPALVPAMQAYLKTDMPMLGVKAPLRAPVVKALRGFDLPDRAAYEAAVRALWALPHREEKYVALELAAQRKRFVTWESLPLFEQLVREGAWWDLVDSAANLVGTAHLRDPERVTPVLERWIDDPDLWIRRVAVIAQRKHRQRTDAALLFRFCAARAHETDFFMRKAIGWALREYARVDPGAVEAFLEEQGPRLSGLSVREARKGLAPRGRG